MNNITYNFSQKRPFYCFPIDFWAHQKIKSLKIKRLPAFAEATTGEGKRHFLRLGLMFYCYLFLPVPACQQTRADRDTSQ